MSMSQSFANLLLNVSFGYEDKVSLPSLLYLGVSSSEPNASTGAVTGEPTAPSYKRRIVGGSSADASNKFFGPASGGIIQNKKEIQMITARESWGKNNYWFVSQSETGNAIIWGELKDAETGVQGVTINAKTVTVFYENELNASIDVPLN